MYIKKYIGYIVIRAYLIKSIGRLITINSINGERERVIDRQTDRQTDKERQRQRHIDKKR